ncbi:MAG: thioredoxin domain-containing protein [Candidatus Limnocylindria bacterium]
MRAIWRHAALVAAIAGAGISAYLLVEYLNDSGGICLTGSGCDEVRLSAYSHILSLPVPLYGLAFYLVAAWVAWRSLSPAPLFGFPPRIVLAGLGAAGIAASAVLTGLEAFVIHSFCTWCLAQAVASLVLGISAFIGLSRGSRDDVVRSDSTRRAQRHAAQEVAAERGLLQRNGLVSAGAMSLLLVGLLLGGAFTNNTGPTPGPSASTSSSLAPAYAPRIGNGPVTVVEFADYQCPACAVVSPELQTLVTEGRITLVYRMYPLPQHQNAELTARAAVAANLQGKFWPMHDQIYATQSDWENLSDADARAYLTQLASSVGLDVTRWTQDLDAAAVANTVATDLDAATTLNLAGTPSLFINGRAYSGSLSLDALRSAVTAAAG